MSVTTGPIDRVSKFAPILQPDRRMPITDASSTCLAAPRESVGRANQGTSVLSSNATDFMLLAIFLNLLAFFAVLVSTVEFHAEKVEQAIASVHENFGGRQAVAGLGFYEPKPNFEVDLARRHKDFVNYLERVAALRRIETSVGSDRIRVEFPPKRLFAEPSSALRRETRAFIVRLANVLSEPSGVDGLAVYAEVTEGHVGDSDFIALIEERLNSIGMALREGVVPFERMGVRLVETLEPAFVFELNRTWAEPSFEASK